MKRILAAVTAGLALAMLTVTPASADRLKDTSPYYGGDAIFTFYTSTTTERCSSGFNMFDGGSYASSTAWHCGGVTWSVGDPRNPEFASEGPGRQTLDTEVLWLSPGNVGANGVWGDPDVSSRAVYSWETTPQDKIGGHVCVSGGSTGEVCGLTNISLNSSPGYATNEVLSRCPGVNPCVTYGDSGGPVYAICTVAACNQQVEAVGLITDVGAVGTGSNGLPLYYEVAWEPIRYVMSYIWANVDPHLNVICTLCSPR